MEATLLANQAEVSGDASTARKFGSINSWIASNDVFGAGGASGGLGNTARTDGTQAALTEANLKTVIKNVWNAGGNPSVIMVGPFNKQKISGFTDQLDSMHLKIKLYTLQLMYILQTLVT
jgi:hypothetical protein